MKVYYKTVIHPAYKSDWGFDNKEWLTYEEIVVNYCCKESQSNWDKAIRFREVSGNPCICICEPGWDEVDNVTINYCPWCGIRVELEERERVRLITKKKEVTKMESYTEEEKI